jgi:Spy/CpxP family protein refolding chaperone
MRAKHWELKDKIAEYKDQLHELYSKEKPDAKTIGNVYRKIFDIQRQFIELHIHTKNKKYDVLTKEQREKLKEWSLGWRGQSTGSGRGMHRMMHE